MEVVTLHDGLHAQVKGDGCHLLRIGKHPMARYQTRRHVAPMHHLHSASTVLRFRLAALLLILICLLAPVGLVLLLQSWLVNNLNLALTGSGLAILSLGLIIPQLAVGSHSRCPLCWTSVLAPKACSPHRHARKFLGSHCLRVAMGILFRKQFRCPYCNESTALDHPHSASKWANKNA